jgi:hypothetical protein
METAFPDGNPVTAADPTWKPLRTTPNFPEYPSAYACHSTAVVEALDAFFGTDKVAFTLDSRVTGTSGEYDRLQGVVKGRRLGARARRVPLPQFRRAGLGPRPEDRPLRQRPFLPAARLTQSSRDTGGG